MPPKWSGAMRWDLCPGSVWCSGINWPGWYKWLRVSMSTQTRNSWSTFGYICLRPGNRCCIELPTSKFGMRFKLNHQSSIFPDKYPDDLQPCWQYTVSLNTCGRTQGCLIARKKPGNYRTGRSTVSDTSDGIYIRQQFTINMLTVQSLPNFNQ